MKNDALGMSDSPLVLTIDVGSSSIRTNLFDYAASRLGELETQVSYQAHTTPDGGVEIDPHALLEYLGSAIDGTLARAGTLAGRVAAVGMCSLVSNVMGIDSRGHATTPIYTWADTRCSAETAYLRSTLDEDAVRERTGCPIHDSYLPARLLWLKRTAPDVWRETERWISLAEWVYLNFLGRAGQSYSVASWGGLLDRHSLAWDTPLLDLLDITQAHLPLLADVEDGVSGLREPYRTRWPALKDVPWFPCAGDGVTSNLGSGCYSAGELAIQVGTSGAMRAVLPGTAKSVPRGLWCYRIDSRSSLLGGALSEGGNLLSWLRDRLGIQDLSQVEKEAADMVPDSHGLTMLPFLAGERSPGWDSAARATISGLSLHTTQTHIMRAAQEAIAYRFGLIYDLLGQVLPPVSRIIASGGALLNTPGWMNVVADVLDHPIVASGEPEASSRGTALLVLRSLGAISSFSDIPPSLGQTYSPDPGRHATYREAMLRQTDLYNTLHGL